MSLVLAQQLNQILQPHRDFIRLLGPLTQANLIKPTDDSASKSGTSDKKKSKVDSSGFLTSLDKSKPLSSRTRSVIGAAYYADNEGNGDLKLSLAELKRAQHDLRSDANSGEPSHELKYERLKEMIAQFEEIDTDNSGTLEGDELAFYFNISLKNSFFEADKRTSALNKKLADKRNSKSTTTRFFG